MFYFLSSPTLLLQAARGTPLRKEAKMGFGSQLVAQKITSLAEEMSPWVRARAFSACLYPPQCLGVYAGPLCCAVHTPALCANIQRGTANELALDGDYRRPGRNSWHRWRLVCLRLRGVVESERAPVPSMLYSVHGQRSLRGRRASTHEAPQRSNGIAGEGSC